MRARFLVLIPFLFSSCEKEAELLFELPLQNLAFVIPAGQTAVETYYFNFPEVPTNAANLLANFGYEESDVSGIIPGSARLSSIFGDGNYNDLFRELVVQICPVGNSGDKCGVEGFYWNLIGQNVGADIDLIPNPLDVSDDLLAEKVHIQVWYRLLRSSDQTIESRLALRFLVQ